MRWAIRLLLLFVTVLLISPFIVSSLLVDGRGTVIPGHVASKDEWILVQYSSWARKLDVSVRYNPPDGYGVSFIKEQVTLDRFDGLKVGDPVSLHYLLGKNVPDYPGWRTLRQMHLLPFVRAADQNTWSGPQALLESSGFAIAVALTVVLVLLLWKILRFPYFGGAVFTCIVFAMAITYISKFPRPMPAPRRNLRTAAGTVKSLDQWSWLFSSSHERGVRADQPIQITGVQFIPEGRTEPVVAVDLIDQGSLPGLKERDRVNVEYEASAPRVALIRGATRHFAERNLRGMIVQGIAMLVVLVGLLAIWALFSRGYRKLIGRRSA